MTANLEIDEAGRLATRQRSAPPDPPAAAHGEAPIDTDRADTANPANPADTADPATEPSSGRRTARSLPAGLADVALGSATSFIVGIDAARHLDPVALGLWGLIFSAYLLASVIPTEFLLVPLESALVSRSSEDQMRAVPRTMLIAALVGVPASMLAMAFAATFSRDIDAGLAGRTALIGVLLGVTSPLQDHLRRLLHQAGWSTGAALVSLCQVVVVLSAVIGLHSLGVRALFVPPLALGSANLASLAVGVVLARRRAGPGPTTPIVLQRATHMGGWLLGAGVADRATQFACLALLSLFVGTSGVGQYEATRVAAQPVLVFALGVLSVYRRPLMRSAQQRQARAARSASRVFAALVAVAAGGYGALVAVRWAGNPLGRLTPAAYEQGGFLVAVVAATAITAVAMAPTAELVGSGWAKPYARQIVYQAVVLVALCLAGLIAGLGVFAWPLALGGRSALLWWTLHRQTVRLYRTPPGALP